MDVIYNQIKRTITNLELVERIIKVKSDGAEIVLLGCTELSILKGFELKRVDLDPLSISIHIYNQV